MNNLRRIVGWTASLAAAFAGAWTGYLAYVAHGHRARWHAQLDVLPQSLVMTSVFTVHYWWLFAVVSILSLLTAGYMTRIGHASAVLKVFIAVNALVGAMIINVMAWRRVSNDRVCWESEVHMPVADETPVELRLEENE